MEGINGKRVKNIHQECIIFLYISLIALFAICLFLYGFFPLKHYENSIATLEDIPNYVENVRVKKDALYKPMIKKLVIMIIDALRWDFVTGPIGKSAMPVVNALVANNSACLLQVKVNAPTVTLPRIKAITTGSIPSFIDVALNLGGKSVVSDNILFQAKNNGYKLIFYGDDTWLKLFPDIFDRHDGTTSFFVTDYTEVDNNVTRHIKDELQKNDWSIMILHYLGLDHIGHIGGPLSPLIKPKLKEMDDIVNQVQKRIAYWVYNFVDFLSKNEQNVPSLFIVCGDHGMKNSGGHGGSTPEETLVPLVAIGTSCPYRDIEPKQIAQIDIGPTLAVMLGIPIPISNLGSVSLSMINELPTSRKLFILYYNSKQVFKYFSKLANYKSRRSYQNYVNAVKLHTTWLTANGQSDELAEEIIFLYNSALRGMKEVLTNSMIKYDLHIMTVAMFFIYHVLYIMINVQRDDTATPKKMLYLVIANIVLWLMITYMWDSKDKTVLYSYEKNNVVLIILIIGTLLVNCYLCARLKCTQESIRELVKGGVTQWIFSLGALVHAISLSSSSYVEEEHQTWYFFWVTLFIFLFYDSIKMLIIHWPSCRHLRLCPNVQICVRLLLLLLSHRILRYLNSTGDKYAHLPDIAGWLQEQECNIFLTLILISALSLLIWICYMCEEEMYKKQMLFFNVIVALCIYLRHMATETVARIPFYPASRGIYEVQIFWSLIIVFFVTTIYRLLHTAKYRRRNFLTLLLFFVIQLWVMVSALLHRPYNIGLLPIQLILSSTVHVMLKFYGRQDVNSHIHSWLGNVFYFYQGNSNSLATIDVASGYVGLESYRPYITGTLLVINTYSAPVLAYLTLLYGVALEKPKSVCRIMLPINRSNAIWRLLPIAIYTIIVSIQRYHLFVWTVFSPKLLYEAMYCAVMYSVMLVMQVTFILHDKINQSYK